MVEDFWVAAVGAEGVVGSDSDFADFADMSDWQWRRWVNALCWTGFPANGGVRCS